MVNDRRIAASRRQGGLTLLEVMVAMAVMSIAIFPLIDAIRDSRVVVRESEVRRTMRQLIDYKMMQILMDQPPEGQEPIYVDGAEGNFGSEFENDKDKEYWFDQKYYNYSFRIDSEEVDLGLVSSEEEEEDEANRTSDDRRTQAATGSSPFGDLGGEGSDESQSQLRYKVTLTVFFRTGNRRLDQSMSVVTYVKHPHEKEAMTGPKAGGEAGANGLGAGAGQVGQGQAATGNGDVRAGQQFFNQGGTKR